MRGHATAGRPTHLDRFKGPALGDASADIVDDIFDGGSDGYFYQTGVIDLAGQGKYLGPFAVIGAHLSIPFRSIFDDQRNIGPGFHVIDVGGFGVDAGLRRERRPGPGHTSFAFDGCHQGGFLTAYKRTGTQSQREIEVKTGAQNVFTQKPQFIGLFDGDG